MLTLILVFCLGLWRAPLWSAGALSLATMAFKMLNVCAWRAEIGVRQCDAALLAGAAVSALLVAAVGYAAGYGLAALWRRFTGNVPGGGPEGPPEPRP